MTELPREVGLSDEDIKMLIEILEYSIAFCPIEGVSYAVDITRDTVENLVSRLEKAKS